MTRFSRLMHAVLGMTLAFLIGIAAMAAQDKAAKTDQAQDKAAAAAAAPATTAPATPGMHGMTHAPGLPGWITHLPAAQQETARKLWLAEGRNLAGRKEMLAAKRKELSALLTLAPQDEKAQTALIKEIAAQEEKLLTGQVALRRALEKEGIPTWGVKDLFGDAKGKMDECMMGGKDGKGKTMGMMSGGHDGHGAAQKPTDAPAAADTKDAGHSGH